MDLFSPPGVALSERTIPTRSWGLKERRTGPDFASPIWVTPPQLAEEPQDPHILQPLPNYSSVRPPFKVK